MHELIWKIVLGSDENKTYSKSGSGSEISKHGKLREILYK